MYHPFISDQLSTKFSKELWVTQSFRIGLPNLVRRAGE